jgi:rhamnulokinase
MLGSLDDGLLALEELHRFPNTPVRLLDSLHWDALRLFHEITQGLAIAGRDRRLDLDGIGVDTWGVDFALMDEDGSLCSNPRHYRDARNNGMLERMLRVVPREEIFAQTGVQFMQINSLVQLYGMKESGDCALESARTLLMMPDLFNYWLTGVKRGELTIASTSQFYSPVKKRWATELFDYLGLPTAILPEIVEPGTFLGPLLPPIAQSARLDSVPVFATGGHDTASAVAAAPAEGGDWLYISSGTWSLMGVELDETGG